MTCIEFSSGAPVHSYEQGTGGGSRSTRWNHRLTPSHWQLSHLYRPGFEYRQWWETAIGISGCHWLLAVSHYCLGLNHEKDMLESYKSQLILKMYCQNVEEPNLHDDVFDFQFFVFSYSFRVAVISLTHYFSTMSSFANPAYAKCILLERSECEYHQHQQISFPPGCETIWVKRWKMTCINISGRAPIHSYGPGTAKATDLLDLLVPGSADQDGIDPTGK